MQQWQWIGAFSIVRHGLSSDNKKLNALVQYDPSQDVWRWSILIDNMSGEKGVAASARLAIQQVEAFFAE